jgi:hypothetical protein
MRRRSSNQFTVKWDLRDQGVGEVTLELQPTVGAAPFVSKIGERLPTFRTKDLEPPEEFYVGAHPC